MELIRLSVARETMMTIPVKSGCVSRVCLVEEESLVFVRTW